MSLEAKEERLVVAGQGEGFTVCRNIAQLDTQVLVSGLGQGEQ